MTSRDFCYWLQGFFEIRDAGLPPNVDGGLTTQKVEVIKRHLAIVFAHEIDPSAGDEKHQKMLNDLHKQIKSLDGGLDDKLVRC